MKRLAIVVLLACSSPPVERLTPLQAPTWTTVPADDELVQAIVGPTGSAEHRADAAAIARDLLLPRLPKQDLQKLRWELQALATSYEMFDREALGDEFLRFAVSQEVGSLGVRASRLAVVRLKHALWPTEPFPETWSNEHLIDPATVQGAAMALHYRMLEIEGRYAHRLPIVFSRGDVELANDEYGEHRSVVLARNQIHIALTGDYSVTAGAIHDELTRRGVKTRRVPEDRPY